MSTVAKSLPPTFAPNPIALIYGVKLLKVGTAYISANICSNFMAQVYMDKVLVNQENPQPLTNFIMMYILIDVMMTAVVIAVFFILASFVGLNIGDVVGMVMQDSVWYLAILGAIGYIVATTMHNKKYFMYKDDGLRAIRALKDVMFQVAAFLVILPLFKLKLA